MEESVALDSSKQKQFVKSVRGIKKLLKNTKKVKESRPVKEQKEQEESKEKDLPKPLKKLLPASKEIKEVVKKGNKIKKREIRKRGLVYLSHIPHGFYEHQMTEYFKQFGVVTNARVIKSKHTGNSKGYAFVEFKEPAVAEIVAETMNNYLMGKRLIKAVCIPPEKQRFRAMRKNWNFKNNPASDHRLRMKKVINADKSEQQENLIAKKLLSKLSNIKEKLKGLGIDYDLFVPVDVPETLNESVETCKVEVNVPSIEGSKKRVKVEKKVKKSEEKKIKTETTDVINNIVVKKENNKTKKQNKNKTDIILKEKPLRENKNLTKNKNLVQEKDKTKPLIKEEKLKEVSKKEIKNFIKINESDDDSDNSVDFDSDAFENMLENDDDDELSLGNDEELSSGNDEELSSGDKSDDINEEIVQRSINVKETKKTHVVTKEKNTSKLNKKNKQGKGIIKNMPVKKKNILSAPVTPKKAKFEKQTKKTLNKVIKKRK